jgi:acetyl esterase
MRLDPPVQQFLDLNAGELAFLERLGVAEQRRYMSLLIDLNFLRFSRPGPAVDSVTDHVVPVEGGQIRCRLYRPSNEAPLPAHMCMHGGGWWSGSIDDMIVDAICRQRCNDAHVVVASVDYRLAPEHPFPTGLNDAFAVFAWLQEHAQELGIDPANISIGGSSAGANIAAALAIKVRDAGGNQPVLQLLEVPALDLTLATSQTVARTPGDNLDAEFNTAVARYLSDPRHAHHPLASPLQTGDLRGLPPAVIFTAEHDPLQEHGERYADRLTEAGVAVNLIAHPGALHGTAMLTGTWEPAAGWQREAAVTLKRAHGNQIRVATG